MSGGSYDHKYFTLEQLAEEIINKPKYKADFTEDMGYGVDMNPHFPERELVSSILEIMADICQDIEWIDSGDHSEKQWDIIVDKLIGLQEVMNSSPVLDK